MPRQKKWRDSPVNVSASPSNSSSSSAASTTSSTASSPSPSPTPLVVHKNKNTDRVKSGFYDKNHLVTLTVFRNCSRGSHCGQLRIPVCICRGMAKQLLFYDRSPRQSESANSRNAHRTSASRMTPRSSCPPMPRRDGIEWQIFFYVLISLLSAENEDST